MTVGEDVAALLARMDASDRRHDEAAEDRTRLWSQVSASVSAREDTNRRLTALEVGQTAMREELTASRDFIRGDLRRVIYGGAASLVIVVALLILSLTRGPDAVGAAAQQVIDHVPGVNP